MSMIHTNKPYARYDWMWWLAIAARNRESDLIASEQAALANAIGMASRMESAR